MRILLDGHMPPIVAQQLQRDGTDAVCLRDWLGGSYRTAPDELILTAASSDDRVLVTYDCRTIPHLLKEWAETGQHHAGVVLVDERTVRPNDIGGLVRTLRALVERRGDEIWHDRILDLEAL